GERQALGPACDVFSLGAILYRLLTGRPLPFGPERPAPSTIRPGLSPQLEAVCLRAAAWAPEARYSSMGEMAAALAACRPHAAEPAAARPLVPASSVRLLFIGVGERVVAQPRQDRLFLDVGNDLGPGVIDHHQLIGGAGSTTGLVLDHPAFIDA